MAKSRIHKTYFKTARLVEGSSLIKVKFPFDKATVIEVKSNFPVREYHKDPKGNYWLIPLTVKNCFKLNSLRFRFSDDLKQWVNKEYFKKKKTRTNFKVEGLKGTLFPYQRDGVMFLEEKNGRALLADEMGLGKTIQALGFIQLHKKDSPAVVVCPSSAKYTWEDEANDWLENPKVVVLSGEKSEPIDPTVNLIIINFEILHHWLAKIRALKPQIIIIDEIHYIKNKKTIRYQAVKKLKLRVPYLIGLSGTPIENRPVELYPIVNMINPSIFANEWHYKQRYCGAVHNGFGWSFKGSSNEDELFQILTDSVMIRRLKKDVLPDLPDKLYSFIPIKIDNWKEYKRAEDDYVQYIEDMTELELRKAMHSFFNEGYEDTVKIVDHKLEALKKKKSEKANPLAQMEALKTLVAKGKLKEIIKYVYDFLETGKKIVLFCEHLFVIDVFMEEFKGKIVKIDGSVPPKKRRDNVKAFQDNDKIQIFIGNKAAEINITLTAASDVGIIEYPQKPGSLKQRIDRLHRIGQKYNVNVRYFVGKNTIDERIAHMLDEKQRTISKVLDGKEPELDENLLLQILNSYKE
jgi:SNF2 family DNA or RNA helicase